MYDIREMYLALIIGKKCKNISEKEAMDVIFGYMILNDVSARDIQEMDKQFTRAKLDKQNHLIHLHHVDHGLQQEMKLIILKISNF